MDTQKKTPKDIIDFLVNNPDASSLMIAPSAPIVLRLANGKFDVMNMIISAREINEIYSAFRMYGQVSDSSAAKDTTGSFAFPVPKVGRFRVNYVIQRGSPVLVVTRISPEIPALNTFLEQTEPAMTLINDIIAARLNFVLLSGLRDHVANVAYGILKFINDSRGVNRLICIVEPQLAYLISHNNSIVVQCESRIDVASVSDGVRNITALNPNILYASGIQSDEELSLARNAISQGIITILGSSILSHKYMVERLVGSTGITISESVNESIRWKCATLTPSVITGKITLKTENNFW